MHYLSNNDLGLNLYSVQIGPNKNMVNTIQLSILTYFLWLKSMVA
jgi:hypothetical protein